MYKWIKPEMLIPVHGERRHMAEQARFGLSEGIPRAIVQSNGDVVRLAPDGPQIIGRERTGRLVYDGDTIIPADGATMGERRRIAANGQISVAVALSGNKVADIEIRIQGVPVEGVDREDFIEDAIDAAKEAVGKGAKDTEKLRESVRLAVRRTATDWTGKKPVVDVMMLQV
jgi:ribonuclease J